MAEQFVMTQKNYEHLKEELEYLVKVKRPEIIERIAEARSHGDLSENAEYDAAREEQRSNEGKIAELEYKIKNADIREEETDNSYVHLNSTVTVYDEDMEEEAVYTVVSVTEVDVMNNYISFVFLVGSALLR
ncbi:MAG: transcription elongation factor GreA, partial [Clostridia bacterium]|nr:transcription elongation factor GreA [Clostridia bacterium]